MMNVFRWIVRLFRFPSSDCFVLRVVGGRVTVEGDKVPCSLVSEIEEELRRAGCERGVIRMRKDGKVVFSDEIDPSLHQRIRNLLLS